MHHIFAPIGKILFGSILALLLPHAFGTETIEQWQEAIDRILEVEVELGAERNNSSHKDPVHKSVERYISQLESIDLSATPTGFDTAFHKHIAAWKNALPLLKQYSKLRGDMHDVFKLIHQKTDALKPIEQSIWTTWYSIELFQKFYRDPIAKRRFVYSSNSEGNFEVLLSQLGQAPKNLSRHPASDNYPVVDRTNQRIAFQTQRHEKFDIYLTDFSGSLMQQLTFDDDHDYLPSFHPKNNYLYFMSWRKLETDENRENHFYRRPIAQQASKPGLEPERWLADTPNNSTTLEWSPDGRYYVYTFREPGAKPAQLIEVDTKTQTKTQLTNLTSYQGTATYSPNGRYIAFYSSNDTVSKIGILNRETKVITWLLSSGFNWYPRWSSDGQWLSVSVSDTSDHKDIDIYAVHITHPEIKVPLILDQFRSTSLAWLE